MQLLKQEHALAPTRIAKDSHLEATKVSLQTERGPRPTRERAPHKQARYSSLKQHNGRLLLHDSTASSPATDDCLQLDCSTTLGEILAGGGLKVHCSEVRCHKGSASTRATTSSLQPGCSLFCLQKHPLAHQAANSSFNLDTGSL
eukprot:3608281-Prymnesium_polylepis.1